MAKEKGAMKSNQARDRVSPPTHVRKFFLTLSCLPVLLAGCVHWPDIATDCESYGVSENYSPMGTLAHIEPLYRDELDVRCAGVAEENAAQGTEISGCVIPHENGVVEAYYWVGDRCAMNHEMCHFKHGPGHTERYIREVHEGTPMPYCPENQLSFTR